MADEKKYYWLRLDRNFFKRHDIRIIESMKNGKEYVLFYMKLLLESIDHEGSLRFNELIPYNDDMLSTITNTNIDIVRSAVQVFQQLDMLEILDDQTIYITDTKKMLGEAKSTDRVKRFREKQKQLAIETDCNVTETLHETEIEIEKEKDIDKDKKKLAKAQASYFENQELNNTFLDFIKMRKSLKNGAMTDRAISMMITKLNRYDTQTAIAMLNQSILNNWKDVYELKPEVKRPEPKPNKFNNFSQRQYSKEDFQKMEQVLLNKR